MAAAITESYFSQFWRSQSLIQVQGDSVSCERSLPSLSISWLSSHCILTWPFCSCSLREEDEPSGVSSFNDINPVRSGPTFMTSINLNYFLVVPSPNILWVRVSTYEFDMNTYTHAMMQTMWGHKESLTTAWQGLGIRCDITWITSLGFSQWGIQVVS